MVIMAPGFFPDTIFPDRYMIDDYWADYLIPRFLRGIPIVTDQLLSTGSIQGLNASVSIHGTGSAPNINSHKGEPTISDISNNKGTIL